MSMFEFIGFHPYSETDKEGDLCNWHFVLFEMWFNTGIPDCFIDKKWDFNITLFDNDTIGFAVNNNENTYFLKLPWCRTPYEYDILNPNGDYTPVYCTQGEDIKWFDETVNVDDKDYKVLATVSRKKFNFFWLPSFLKERIFSTTKYTLFGSIPDIITFQYELKDGNIEENWLHFKQSIVPKLIRGRNGLQS